MEFLAFDLIVLFIFVGFLLFVLCFILKLFVGYCSSLFGSCEKNIMEIEELNLVVVVIRVLREIMEHREKDLRCDFCCIFINFIRTKQGVVIKFWWVVNNIHFVIFFNCVYVFIYSLFDWLWLISEIFFWMNFDGLLECNFLY